MIIRRIEVKDAEDIKEKGKAGLSLAALFLSLPWCCIMPAVFSVLGFLGAAGAAGGFLVEVFYPLFVISILLLGRAHYLSFYKKRGSRISMTVVFVSTSAALALWAFRFGLITI